MYRGTSLIRNRLPIEPYRRAMPWALWWSKGEGRFLLREVLLYTRSPPGSFSWFQCDFCYDELSHGQRKVEEQIW